MGFAITRDEALQRLEEFVPHAGSDYAKRRNYDYGRGAHHHVSGLSAALRRRTLLESETIAKTLSAHSLQSCEKYIQEVFWRTYWKGWLEMRPSLWRDYCGQIATGFAESAQLHQAYEGRTGIACFDSWHAELIETNYLHNHARMWFASIWIHTLQLPWQAGAALFMHHLLDGDPASNTLGWRWVAGLQTRGKAYAARAENIAQFTNDRFAPFGELQEDVAALAGPENPPAMALRDPRTASGKKALLLITPEDCHPETLDLPDVPDAIATMPANLIANRATAVQEADEAAMADAMIRSKAHYGTAVTASLSAQRWQDELAELMTQTGADHIVMAFQPTGLWHDCLQSLTLPVKEVMRPYDGLCWPHAKKGFFPFKEKIPHFLKSL